MIVQKYREFEIKNKEEGFFIVTTKSRKALMQEFYNYCKEYPEQHIGYYIHPVKPQKGCPIAEYSMEVCINPKGLPFFNMVQ